MLKKILVVSFSIAFILFLSLKLDLNIKAFDVVATFLSITTGFTITALSIMTTSPFSRNLYEKESAKNNSKTLFHELVDKFRRSMLLFIVTISFIILLNLFKEDYTSTILTFCKTKFILIEVLKTTILYFSILSLISFVILFNTFSKFVVKSGSII